MHQDVTDSASWLGFVFFFNIPWERLHMKYDVKKKKKDEQLLDYFSKYFQAILLLSQLFITS